MRYILNAKYKLSAKYRLTEKFTLLEANTDDPRSFIDEPGTGASLKTLIDNLTKLKDRLSLNDDSSKAIADLQAIENKYAAATDIAEADWTAAKAQIQGIINTLVASGVGDKTELESIINKLPDDKPLAPEGVKGGEKAIMDLSTVLSALVNVIESKATETAKLSDEAKKISETLGDNATEGTILNTLGTLGAAQTKGENLTALNDLSDASTELLTETGNNALTKIDTFLTRLSAFLKSDVVKATLKTTRAETTADMSDRLKDSKGELDWAKYMDNAMQINDLKERQDALSKYYEGYWGKELQFANVGLLNDLTGVGLLQELSKLGWTKDGKNGISNNVIKFIVDNASKLGINKTNYVGIHNALAGAYGKDILKDMGKDPSDANVLFNANLYTKSPSEITNYLNKYYKAIDMFKATPGISAKFGNNVDDFAKALFFVGGDAHAATPVKGDPMSGLRQERDINNDWKALFGEDYKAEPKRVNDEEANKFADAYSGNIPSLISYLLFILGIITKAKNIADLKKKYNITDDKLPALKPGDDKFNAADETMKQNNYDLSNSASVQNLIIALATKEGWYEPAARAK